MVFTPVSLPTHRLNASRTQQTKFKMLAASQHTEADDEHLDKRPNSLGVSKRAWTPSEDKMLQEIVEKNGAHRWSTVATYLPGRMGKQCRERCALPLRA